MLTFEEKNLVNEILEFEEQIFYKQGKLHNKIIDNAKRRKEAKEMTVLASIYEREGDPDEFHYYLEKEMKKRINILIYQKSNDSTIPDNDYANHSWLFHLVRNGESKTLQKYLFKNNFSNLSQHREDEDLLFESVRKYNHDTTKCLLKYKCKISINLLEYLEENYDNQEDEKHIKQAIILEYEKNALNEKVSNVKKSLNKHKDVL